MVGRNVVRYLRVVLPRVMLGVPRQSSLWTVDAKAQASPSRARYVGNADLCRKQPAYPLLSPTPGLPLTTPVAAAAPAI